MLYDYEHQVLVGTILGGSSLVKPPKGKNYYLSMCNKNSMWLQYKMAEMPTYFKNPTINFYSGTHRCNSSCSEMLTRIKGNLYNGKDRKITMEVLNCLRDIALAIWFLDGGSKTGRGRKNAYLNTTKFGDSGTNIIHQYFNELEIDCNINKDSKRSKVVFTVDGTQKLFKIIGIRFPTFIFHRLA